jgi:hypothetical protein
VRDVTPSGNAYFVDHIARRTFPDAHGQLTLYVEDLHTVAATLDGHLLEARVGGAKIGVHQINASFHGCSLTMGVTTLTAPLELCLVDPSVGTEPIASAFVQLLELGAGGRSSTASVDLISLSHQLQSVTLHEEGESAGSLGDDDEWVDLNTRSFGKALIRLTFAPATEPLLEQMHVEDITRL